MLEKKLLLLLIEIDINSASKPPGSYRLHLWEINCSHTFCCGVCASILAIKIRWEINSSQAYTKPGALVGLKMWNVLLKEKFQKLKLKYIKQHMNVDNMQVTLHTHTKKTHLYPNKPKVPPEFDYTKPSP